MQKPDHTSFKKVGIWNIAVRDMFQPSGRWSGFHGLTPRMMVKLKNFGDQTIRDSSWGADIPADPPWSLKGALPSKIQGPCCSHAVSILMASISSSWVFNPAVIADI